MVRLNMVNFIWPPIWRCPPKTELVIRIMVLLLSVVRELGLFTGFQGCNPLFAKSLAILLLQAEEALFDVVLYSLGVVNSEENLGIGSSVHGLKYVIVCIIARIFGLSGRR
jgi:hypothetical protein